MNCFAQLNILVIFSSSMINDILKVEKFEYFHYGKQSSIQYGDNFSVVFSFSYFSIMLHDLLKNPYMYDLQVESIYF